MYCDKCCGSKLKRENGIRGTRELHEVLLQFKMVMKKGFTEKRTFELRPEIPNLLERTASAKALECLFFKKQQEGQLSLVGRE